MARHGVSHLLLLHAFYPLDLKIKVILSNTFKCLCLRKGFIIHENLTKKS